VVELLRLAGLAACCRVGEDRLRIAALLEYQQFVSGWRCSCPIVLGSVVAKGRGGWLVRMLWRKLWLLRGV